MSSSSYEMKNPGTAESRPKFNGSDRGKRVLVTHLSPVQPPPAKRLKQACLTFKVISIVEPNASLKRKRELWNDGQLALITTNRSSDVSSTKEPSPKENQLKCAAQDSNESDEDVVVLEPEKGQRSISEFLAPATLEGCHEPLPEAPSEDKSSQASAQSSQSSVTPSSSDYVGTVKLDDANRLMVNGSCNGSVGTFSESLLPDCFVSLERTVLNETGEARLDSSEANLDSSVGIHTEIPSNGNSCKTIKRYNKKVKKDPAGEIEKARLKEERRKIQEEREKWKLELFRLKTENMEQRLKLKQEKKEFEECMKQRKLETLDAKRKEQERLRKEKLDFDEEKKREKNRLEEEENRKKQKTKAAFASFFVKKPRTQTVFQKPKNLGTFLPFQIKENMRLAPTHRNKSCNTSELKHTLDSVMSAQSNTRRYLDEIKVIDGMPRSCGRTWTAVEDNKDVEIIEDDDVKTVRKAKLLQFVENVRPPYWGTWCKTSAIINPRNPLKRDENFFDYNLDSDEEWDDEVELGESLSHTEDEKESEDDYEVDNELFVPHGYLSEEEAHDDDEKQAISPQTLKAQLKIKEQEFLKDRKKKCLQINPRVYGCIWMNNDENEPNKVLEDYAAVVLVSSPIDTRFSIHKATGESGRCRIGEIVKSSPATKHTKELPNEAMRYLIRLVHGNRHSSKLIGCEFQTFWERHVDQQMNRDEETSVPSNPSRFSNALLQSTIRKIATWGKFPDKGPLGSSLAWYVTETERQKYGLAALPIPNKWEYCISPETRKNFAPSTFNKSPTNGAGNIDFFTKSRLTSPSAQVVNVDTVKNCQ